MQYPHIASVCSLFTVSIYDEQAHNIQISFVILSQLLHWPKANNYFLVFHYCFCLYSICINVCNAWPLSLSLCTPGSHFKLLFVALSPQFYATFVLPFKHTWYTAHNLYALQPYCACMCIHPSKDVFLKSSVKYNYPSMIGFLWHLHFATADCLTKNPERAVLFF